MGNRFLNKKNYSFSLLRSLLLPVLVFSTVAFLFLWGMSGLSRTTQRERLASVKNAITRAAVQCYAIEGQYPPGIKYMQEHYGLSVDLDKYIVDYRVFASNIMPSITVLPIDFEDDEYDMDLGLEELDEEDWEALNGLEDLA